MSNSANVLSNSTVAVDFNKEISGLMTDSAHAAGRELKLAVAIYSAPANFDVINILGHTGSKSKSEAIRKALLVHSEAFKTHVDRMNACKKAASANSMKGFTAKAEYEAANRVVIAAQSMFERALIMAYFLTLGRAVVTKVTDKALHVRFDKQVNVGDAQFDAGQTDILTRKQAYDNGRKLCGERGLIGNKTVTKKAKGAPVATGSGKVIEENATTLADTVAALPAKERADITTTPGYENMIAKSIRARFEADGVIEIGDLIEFLRKSDALQGVRIETAIKPVRQVKKA